MGQAVSMGRLIYSAITSLDGYLEDSKGKFDWAMPSEEVFRYVNELEQFVGTYLYGRRMYETMRYWETAPLDGDTPDFERLFIERWRAANKVVYSRTLKSVNSSNTRIVRVFEGSEVAELKSTTKHDLTVGGAELAGQAISAGQVDEIQQFVAPVIVGGGKSWLPSGVRLDLEQIDSRRLAGGFMLLRYLPKPGGKVRGPLDDASLPVVRNPASLLPSVRP